MSLMESFLIAYRGAEFQEGDLMRALQYVVETSYDEVFE
jgi:hypothetical protein